MKPRVYAAGPIGGLSYEAATDWREYATKQLGEAGITVFSPMRAKSFLRGKANLTWLMDDLGEPMATSKGIQCRDRNDCTKADALLVNLKGTTRASIGTCFEIAWAHLLRIPVIVVAEADNLHIAHPMAKEMIDFRVDDLDQAINIVKYVLLPGEAE